MIANFQQINNYIKFFSQYYLRKPVCTYPPLVIMVEPTNLCNLKCPMCAHKNMKRKNGSMEFSAFKRIIDNNYRIMRRLWLYNLGEPLLAKDLPEMISYAHSRNIHVKVNTNATLLNEELAYRLIRSGLDVIYFSFEGFDEDLYEIIRENANFQTTKENIKKFIEVRNRLNANTVACVEMVDTGVSNKKSMKNMDSLYALGVDRINIVPLHRWPVQENVWDERDFPRKNRPKQYQHCIMPWVMLGILWDGRIIACCDDFDGDFVVGDVNQTPNLIEIWNNEKMVYLRRSLVKKEYKNIPTCKYCEKIWTTSFVYPVREYIKREFWELKKRIWNGKFR